MFTEQQNLAIVRTELDSVFFQEFQYDAAEPGIATANTGAIFKPLQTEHAQYIEEVFKGSGLWPAIGETQTVPLATPQVANKLTTSVKDFAQGIEISKDLFDRLTNYCRSKIGLNGETPLLMRTIPYHVFA